MSGELEPWACPACGIYDVPAVLKEAPNNRTVQCAACRHVSTQNIVKAPTFDVRMIVSDGARSRTDSLTIGRDEIIRVGDEFDHGDNLLEVTKLEVRGGMFPRRSGGEGLHAVYVKALNEIVVKFSVNVGEETLSLRHRMGPNDLVRVGEVYRVEGDVVVVKTLKSSDNETVRKGGLPARAVRRAYCDVAPIHAQPGDFLRFRDFRQPASIGAARGPARTPGGPRNAAPARRTGPGNAAPARRTGGPGGQGRGPPSGARRHPSALRTGKPSGRSGPSGGKPRK